MISRVVTILILVGMVTSLGKFFTVEMCCSSLLRQHVCVFIELIVTHTHTHTTVSPGELTQVGETIHVLFQTSDSRRKFIPVCTASIHH